MPKIANNTSLLTTEKTLPKLKKLPKKYFSDAPFLENEFFFQVNILYLRVEKFIPK